MFKKKYSNSNDGFQNMFIYHPTLDILELKLEFFVTVMLSNFTFF